MITMLKTTILALIVGIGTISCGGDWQKILDEFLTGQEKPPSEEQPPTDTEQPSSDSRSYRAIELENKLVAFLIHDPKAKKSAAAMDVNVGSLQDPWEHQGLAHFLEHMLFLGTTKYPEVGEYDKYLSSYQGYHNAYTSAEHTNYFFEVNHEGFAGALDRFAQFFISPLFTPEYVEREMNAVHSEHQKNLQNDAWRAYRIATLTYKDGHPRQKFSTGDLETLKNVTNEILIDFYNKHYSANLMRLAIISPLSLDEQEQMLTTLFAEVRNNNQAKFTYDSDIYDDDLLPQRIEIEPVTDIRYVNLSFATPTPYDYWQSKPNYLLASLLGDEGKGSLLSLLKAKGYATELWSGIYSSSYAGEFQTQITLTELGLTEVNEVVSMFFSYISMLKEASLKTYFYQENKQLAQIEYDYRAPLEGADAVSFYATLIHRFSPMEALKNESLFFEFSPLDFHLFLNKVTAKKLKMTVVAKGVETDKVEKYYGTNYSVKSIPSQVYMPWQNPKLFEALHYPLSNPFIPDNLDILANDRQDKPYKLLDTEQGVFWFQQDTEFLRPKAQLYLNILTNKTNSNPREKLLSIFYERSLQESINEWKYPILTAGLDFSISRNDSGIAIDIKGYSDKLPLLLSEIGQRLKTITINEKTFSALQNQLKRDLENTTYQPAYRQVIGKGSVILDLNAIDYSEYIQLVDSISLADVHTYSGEVFKEIAYEGVAYGNLDKDVIGQKLTGFIAQLDAKILPMNQRKSEQILKLHKKYNYTFAMESNNHALVKIAQMGERSPKLDGLLRIIDTHMYPAFFTELRTNQQLGYIVHSGLYYRKKMLGIWFIVQSSDYNPKEIDERIKNFLPMMTAQFAGLTSEDLETYKQNIIKELQEPEKTIFERHERLKAEAIKLDGDFDYRQKVIAALQEITREDIVEIWGKLAESGQLNVSLFAKGTTTESLPDTVEIENLAEFKRSQPIYE